MNERELLPSAMEIDELAARKAQMRSASGEASSVARRSSRGVLAAVALFLVAGLGTPIDGEEVAKREGTSDAPVFRWPADIPAPAIAPFDPDQAKTYQQAWAEHLSVPVEYVNSIGMKFMLIPAGEFMMGSTPEESKPALRLANNDHWRQCIESERPKHKAVVTRAFYLGAHEVTQVQYEQVMGRNPSHFAATGGGASAVDGLDTRNHPVDRLAWAEAAEFCSKLSRLEQLKPFYSTNGDAVTMLDGRGYRLPTEAEWEFACRAGTTTNYWCGDDKKLLGKVGWLPLNARRRTHPVGQLRANPFGLYDVHGNVWEWVQDWWELAYYEQFVEQPAVDPTGPPPNTYRLLKGGSWFQHESLARSPAHMYLFPHDKAGVRLVLALAGVKQAIAKRGRPAKQAKRDVATTKPAAASPANAIAPFDANEAKAHQLAWAKRLGIPAEHTNSIGMKFVLIPPGKFTMGSRPEESEPAMRVANNSHWRQCVEGERPQHQVILTRPYYLGIYEVTQAQYEKVMGTNPSQFTATGSAAAAVANLDTRDFPVENVNWNNAAEFCATLSELEQLRPFYSVDPDGVSLLVGNGYRLPTEAEWEFACRAGTKTKYWCGNDDQAVLKVAWLSRNAGRRTHPVGQFEPNPFGLFDFHGNVREWVQDWWELAYYDQFVEQPAVDPEGPSAGDYRVVRGGNWFHHISNCRSPARLYYFPADKSGFRVALSPEAVKQATTQDVRQPTE